MIEHFQPTILVDTTPDSAVIGFIPGLLSEAAIQSVRRQLDWLIDEPGRRALLLDLDQVEVPTAGSLGKLVALHHEVQAAGGELVLCNVHDQAYEVFEMTGLTQLLDVRAKDGQAV